jgi:hypothetical protein
VKPHLVYRKTPAGVFQWSCRTTDTVVSGNTPAEAYAEWKKIHDRKKAAEDFHFMALCAAKGNMGMYDLFRDRS